MPKFATINRTEAHKIFINVRNVSGATVSAGAPMEIDCVVATDGNAVTQCKSGALAALFLGLMDEAKADSSYGLLQTYGFRDNCWISRACAGNTPGQFLQPIGGYFDAVTMSAATTSGWTYVTLLETIAASAAYSSAAQVYSNHAVFLRAM